jgi:tRNA (cmo5U34)-methyltransferase
MNQDKTMPQGRWEFDEDVANVFDSMLENSIPNYDTMRLLTFALGKRFVQPSTTVVDLGTSLGRAIKPFISCKDKNFNDTRFVGYEVSEPMRERLLADQELTQHQFRLEDGSFLDVEDFGSTFVEFGKEVSRRPSLIMSVLTLQFTPIEYRPRTLRRIYKSLVPGGAFILVEKVLGRGGLMDDLLVDAYYDLKAGNGYSREQISCKRKALEGVLVPTSASYNEQMLADEGFRLVECFYRTLNFAGWIAVKEG